MMCQIVADYMDTQDQISKAHKYINFGYQMIADGPESDLIRLYLNARTGRLLSREKGKSGEAAELFKSVIEQAEKMPSTLIRDSLLYETYNYLGQTVDSPSAREEAYKRSAEIAYHLGNDQDARSALQNMAFDIIDYGKPQEALEIANQCLEEGLRGGMLEDQAYSFIIIGAAYTSLGNYHVAIENLLKGISIFQDIGNHWNDIYSYYELAKAYLGTGNVPAAYDAAKKCLQSVQQTNEDGLDAYEQALAYEILGRVLAALEDWLNAEEHFKKSIKIMHEEEAFFQKARVKKFYGLALIKKGEAEKGIKFLKSSLTVMKKMKVDYEANAIHDILSQLKR